MSDEEGGLDPAADLDGLDELLASTAEPLGDGDDTADTPGLYVPLSQAASGGSQPLPVDTSRLGEGDPPSGDARGSGRPSGLPATWADAEPPEPPEQSQAGATVDRAPFSPADAEVGGPPVDAEAPASPAAAVHRGPRSHPAPVKAPPPPAPPDRGAVAVPPPAPPVERPPAAPSAAPAPPREVPVRPAHPRVRRWFGRDRGERTGDAETTGQPPGES